jgi:hypothetical protein
MMRAAVASVLVAWLASTGCDPNCVIEDIVDERFADTTYVDCGRLTSYDEAAYRAAHECVAASIAAGQPFAVIFARPNDDSRIASAYLGVTIETGIELQSLYFDSGAGGSGDATGTSRCESLTDMGLCPPGYLNSGLCFECTGAQFLDRCPAL